MRVARCTAADLADWTRLRAALWPDGDDHAAETAAVLDDPDLPAFLCRDAAGAPLGFVEAALRHDHVNGCDTSPVGFVEGLYVGRGVGRALVEAVAGWARSRGCTELASDALLDNPAAHAFHAALGFAETERVACFKRPLG